MKKFLKGFIALSLGLAMVGCAKEYDDTALKSKVDELSKEVNTLKAQQQAMQAVIDVWKAGGYIASIDDSVPGQHTITFYGDNGKVVVLYDGEDGEQGPAGEDGDAYFKSIVTDENGVTFTLNDEEGTSFTIPFAKAFKLVINNLEAEVEAGKAVDFPYEIQNANATTTVDVFAGGNYAATVNEAEKKIVVTPPTPAENGSVLAWAQNEEGLFSMKKLSFIVKAETEVKTTQEELEAIPGEAGDFVVNVVSNVDITVETPTVDWVSVAVTKADYKLTLTLAENITGAPRETEIIVVRKDNRAQVQKIKIVQLYKKVLTVERVWGKYSTAEAAWNSYFSGKADSDRNLAMDDDYIYVPESSGTAKIWRIPVDGTSAVSTVNVEGVSGGTHAITCVRMVPNTAAGVNGGKDFLMGVSLTTNDSADALRVYSWGKGTDAAPTKASAQTWCNRRLGDKFTVYGSLQDGALFFKDYENASSQGAFMVLRMAWSEVPKDGFFNPRRTNMFVEGGMGAYYPYPGDATNGIYTSTESSKFTSFTSSPLSTSPNETGTFTDAGGYYVDAHGFNYFEYNGKRYIAYVKNAGDGDGRFYVIEGESTTSWADMLGSKRNVIYQAAIQEDLAFKDGDYHAEMGANPSPKTSGNSGIDCAVRIKDDAVYFAVMKQHVGLSLFKMSMK